MVPAQEKFEQVIKIRSIWQTKYLKISTTTLENEWIRRRDKFKS